MRFATVRYRTRLGQRGLSLVEMMVGITVGLFIVAAAAMLVTTQLGDNRRLLLETQVQQDLRATADIITRELRRAGYWAGARQSYWYPASSTGIPENPRAGLTLPSASEVVYEYDRDINNSGLFGFKLENGRVKTFMGGGSQVPQVPQDLTDWNVLRITALTIVPQDGPATLLPCPRECAGGGTACWPTLTVRELVVTITGQAANDAAVQRTVTSRVRLRNDLVAFNDAANPNDICPR